MKGPLSKKEERASVSQGWIITHYRPNTRDTMVGYAGAVKDTLLQQNDPRNTAALWYLQIIMVTVKVNIIPFILWFNTFLTIQYLLWVLSYATFSRKLYPPETKMWATWVALGCSWGSAITHHGTRQGWGHWLCYNGAGNTKVDGTKIGCNAPILEGCVHICTCLSTCTHLYLPIYDKAAVETKLCTLQSWLMSHSDARRGVARLAWHRLTSTLLILSTGRTTKPEL